MLSGVRADDGAAFWTRTLAGAPPVLLETDRPRTPERAFDPHSLAAEIPEQLCASLEALAAGCSTTLAGALCAGYAALLERYSGSVDVCIAAELPEPLVLRLDLRDDPSYAELLGRVHAVVDDALGSGLGGRGLTEMLRSAGHDPSEAPSLLDVAFAMRTDAPDPRGEAFATRAELALGCVRNARGVTLRWEFNALLFDRETVQRMNAHFLRLLASAAAEPQVSLSRLSMMDATERAGVLALGQGPLRPYEREATITTLFERAANAVPGATAVEGPAGRLTYRELDDRSSALAAHFARIGVASGATVGVALERSIDLPVALLGILKAGAAYVPLDPAYPAERLAFIVADAAVALIVTAEATRAPLEGHGAPVFCFDGEFGVPGASAPLPSAGVAPDALAYVTYTSGSTGRAKGVAVTHRGVVRLVRNTNFLDPDDDGFLQYAPVAFDASTLEIWGPLLNGGRLIVPPPGLLSIAELAATIETFDVTTLFLTTSLFQRMVDANLPSFGRLRRLMTGGEVASPAHFRRFLEAYPTCRLIHAYGPTENTTFSTTWEVRSAEKIGARVPIGSPIANSSAYVVDRHLAPVPVGVPGELCVGGDGVARGYLNLPELTAERFVPDPFAQSAAALMYRTGDRVRRLPDGTLDFLGRNDDQVKIRGHRIELAEIELGLQSHPHVRDACVVVGQRAGEKVLTGYAVVADGQRIGPKELRAYLATKLPAYMIPNQIVVLERLPEHASGKVDRVALSRMASAAPAPETRVPPRPLARSLDAAVAAIWRELLGLDETPGFDENFFDLGGDSLQVLNLQLLLESRLHVNVTAVELFEHTTVRKLASFVRLQTQTAASS